MKTMAIRLDDDTSAQLTAIAQLEETSVADLIRQAIDAHIDGKRQRGELAEKAQAALADIDREASAKKGAITALFGAEGSPTTRPKGGRRQSSAE